MRSRRPRPQLLPRGVQPGRAAACDADGGGRVQLLDAASAEPFGRALGAVGSTGSAATATGNLIDSVAFSTDGALLAAGGSGPVTLWNRLLWTSAGCLPRRERLCGLVGRNPTRLEWPRSCRARPTAARARAGRPEPEQRTPSATVPIP
jgi:hypothetical protein